MSSQEDLTLPISEQAQAHENVNEAPVWFTNYMAEFEKRQDAKWNEFKKQIISEIDSIKEMIQSQMTKEENQPLVGSTPDLIQALNEENANGQTMLDEATVQLENQTLEDDLNENDKQGIEEVQAFLMELTEENFFQLPKKLRVWSERSIYIVVDLFFEKAKRIPDLLDALAFMVEPIIRIDPKILDYRKIVRNRCQDSFTNGVTEDFRFIGKLYVAGLLTPRFIHDSVLPFFESDIKQEIKGLCDILKIVAMEDVFRYQYFYIFDYTFKLKRLAAKGLLVKKIVCTIDYILGNPCR